MIYLFSGGGTDQVKKVFSLLAIFFGYNMLF